MTVNTTYYPDTLVRTKAQFPMRYVLATVRLWSNRARQRKRLAQLTYFQLQDIGVTHIEAQGEANKYFWQK